MVKDVPMALQRYKFQNYLKEIFLDSDTKLALLSGAPFDDESWWLLSNEQIAQARGAINKTAGTRRLFAHTVVTPGQPGWMENQVDRGIAESARHMHPTTVGRAVTPCAATTSRESSREVFARSTRPK